MRFKRLVLKHKLVGALAALSLSALVAVAGVVPAMASTGTVAVTGGTLAFVSTPGNPSLTAITLNGTNQNSVGTLPMDVGDNTGSGAGWNITMTSTTFAQTTPAESLATTATTAIATPTDACDASVTCTLATNAITYPYALPAAGTAPTATKMYNAAALTGLANQTVTPTFHVAIPANTIAATYVSTWTISLVSAP